MNSCTNKKYNFPHKNWLFLLNVHEKQWKKASRPTYSNLYAYAANNPVHYIDPDGRLVIKGNNSILSFYINQLYINSPTFQKQYDKLFQEENGINQKFLVVLSTNNYIFPGNTVTNDSKVLFNIVVSGLNKTDNYVTNYELKEGEIVQGIFINIDLEQIAEKLLNVYEVISEEICHAVDCASYGAEKWNEKCLEEDSKYENYFEKPREIFAKELTKIIMQEIFNEK